MSPDSPFSPDSPDYPEQRFNQPPVGPAPLRVSDAERNDTIRVLQRARREGRLAEHELEERVQLARQAWTQPELQQLTRDLVAVRDSYNADEAAAPIPYLGSTDNGLARVYGRNQVSSIFSEHKRDGNWEVPGVLQVTSVFGSVKLDMREATFTTAEVTVVAKVVCGDLKIWVPQGVGVVDDTHTFMAESKLKGLDPQQPGRPVLRISGHLVMGELTVYGSRHISLGDRIKGKF